jgi:hypothetical protein
MPRFACGAATLLEILRGRPNRRIGSVLFRSHPVGKMHDDPYYAYGYEDPALGGYAYDSCLRRVWWRGGWHLRRVC